MPIKIDKAELAEKINALEGLDNETKAQLLELLHDRKRYGLVWEDKPEDVEERLREELPVLVEDKSKAILSEDEDAPNHILIEGDNLEALTALSYTHKGKFDVIYIDPPYNTGAKNWVYNNDYVDKDDAFRHSKWISMMNRRLVIARRLLKLQGVLILAIDENELATIKLLLESIFGNSYEVDCITVVQNPRGIQGKNFSYTNEYAIFVIPKGDKVIGDRKIPDEEIDWRNLRDNGGESLRTDARNCFYPIITDGKTIVGFGDVVFDESIHPKQTECIDDLYYIYPIDINGIERKWRYARQTVASIINNLRVRNVRGHLEIEIGKNFGTYRTVWVDPRYDANEYGKKLINTIIPNCPFDFPKSIYNVYDCLYAVVANNPNAKILDFFAGSGTTMHATMMLNQEDGGHRQCILVTNNENNICEEVTYERNKRVINGYTTPKGEAVEGLHNNTLRYYRTDFVGRENTLQNRRKLVYLATDMLCIKEDCYTEQPCVGKAARLFVNKEKHLIIVYNPDYIPEVVAFIQGQRDTHYTIYVFADGEYPYTDDFMEVSDQVELCAIPAAILNAMRKVLPKKKKILLNDIVPDKAMADDIEETLNNTTINDYKSDEL